MSWTHQDRFDAVCAGEPADRPIVSAWRHFRDEEYSSKELAEVSAHFVQKWDLDWVKLNPRAVYYGEIWGNKYEVGNYAERDIPLQQEIAIEHPKDLLNIEVQTSAVSSVLQEQIEFVKASAALNPDKPILQTFFSPLSVLVQLAGLSYYNGMPVFGKSSDFDIQSLLLTDKALTHRALKNITETFSTHFSELAEAGANGVFYATTGTANDQLLSAEQFAEFSTPYDLELLNSLPADSARILHTCGDSSHPEYFANYPVHALSWDHFAPNNPGFDTDFGPVFAGGVDHRKFLQADADDLRLQLEKVTHAYSGKPYLLVPTCSIRSSAISDEGMQLLSHAAHN